MADAPKEHPHLPCAVKFYTHAALDQPEVAAAFLEQARKARQLEAPFLVRIHRVLDLRSFRADGWPAVATVSPLLEPSLEQVLADLAARSERLPVELVFSWACNLYEAVEALHGGHRYVHGHIKPANVLLRLGSGQCYRDLPSLAGAQALLADLAGARPIGMAAADWWLQDGEWRAPEVSEQTRAASPAEDLYALGLLLQRLVALADGDLAALGEAARRLADTNPDQRLTAKRALRAILFWAETGCGSELEAVILRPSEAQSGHHHPNPTTNPPSAPGGAHWPEFAGVPGYAILRPIGAGGMGSVYEACDVALNRSVAIKTSRPELGRESLERLRREATALARINHPNIVQIYGAGGEGACGYLIEELIHGPTLEQRVRTEGPLEAAEAARIAQVLAEAMACVHNQGVLHRDIKPSNVLLAAHGLPKLADFGLAKLVDEGSTPLTAVGTVMGTMGYMAPEQFMGADRADTRADVYGLGATLYFMLTQRSPRQARTIPELWRESEQPVGTPREYNPEVPAELEAICLRCLACRPEDRYQTAAEMAEGLAAFLCATAALSPAKGLSRRQQLVNVGTDASLQASGATAGQVPPHLARASLQILEDEATAEYLQAKGPHLARASLQILKGPNERTVLPLEGDRFVIGRNPDCAVVIPGTSVSREHAQILRIGGKYFIEDNQSRNGTFVNNQQIQTRTLLKDNDRIKICDFLCTFQESVSPKPLPPELRHEESEPDEPEGPSTYEASLGRLSQNQVLESQPAEKLKALLDISNSLTRTLDVEALFPKIAETLFQTFRQADRFFLILREEAPDRLIARMIKTRRPQAEASARFSKSIVKRCLDAGESVLSEDASTDSRFGLAQSIAEFRIRSVMCVPLMLAEGKAFGVIQVDTQDRAKKFTEDDLKLLIGVANVASTALENAKLHQDLLAHERFQRGLALAREVQLSFLPKKLPEVAGYEFFAYCEQRRDLGGDYYDYFPLPDGKLAVTIGDVAGHGIPAALVATSLTIAVRWCLQTCPDLGQAISKLNGLLYEFISHDRFVTLAAVVLDPVQHKAMLVNAGHSSPLVYRRAKGTAEACVPHALAGLPLGVVDELNYDSCEVSLEPGDSLVLLTDGVEDARNVNEVNFQTAGVERVLHAAGHAGPRHIGERLVAAVRQHAAGRNLCDDLTVVALGRHT